MIDDEDQARAFAGKVLRDVWLYAGGRAVGADAPEMREALELFRAEVSPSLHRVFDEVAAAGPQSLPAPRASEGGGRALQVVIGVGLLALLGGSAWCAQKYFFAPGLERDTALLDSWAADVRAGHGAPPSSPGPTTDAALRALAASSSHRVIDTQGAYGSGTGTTCFRIELTGPAGTTPIAVRITDSSGPSSHVTGVGLDPPCRCGRNGRLMFCD